MYNPYLEEFLPVAEEVDEERGEEVKASVVVPSSEVTASALDHLSKLKELGKFGDLLKLEQLGIFSSIGDMLGKKKGKEDKKLSFPEGESEGFFQQWKKALHLEDIDSGDVLLVVIVIYLMLEGDDKLELGITLGVLAFMWYLESKKEEKEDTHLIEG